MLDLNFLDEIRAKGLSALPISGNKRLLLFLGLLAFILTATAWAFFAVARKTVNIVGNSGTLDVVESGGGGKNPPATIVVEAAGAVKAPGVYEISGGTRYSDLLKLAGGLSETADVFWVAKNINLAEKLEDSRKVYFPFEWDAGLDVPDSTDGVLSLGVYSGENEKSEGEKDEKVSDGKKVEIDRKINVNTSSKAELKLLVGIGEAYSGKIIANRPYKDFLELQKKSGVPETVLEKVKSEISY